MSVARGISSTNALTKVAWSLTNRHCLQLRQGQVHIDSQDEHVKFG